MNKSTKLAVLLPLAALVLAGCWNPFAKKEPEPTVTPTPTVSPEQLGQIKQQLREKTGLTVPTLPPPPSLAPSATPTDKTAVPRELVMQDQLGSGSTGLVSWIPQDKQIKIALLADLPDLQPKQVYQVWLRSKDGKLQQLGQLKSVKGGWSWQGQVSSGDYQELLVSRESVIDNQVETVVLQTVIS